jgi:predicted peptidase
MPNIRYFLLICSLLLTAIAGFAQAPAALTKDEMVQRFEARVFTNADGKTQPYRLLTPKDYDPGKAYPLVLFLHGVGESGTDNLKQVTNSAYLFAGDSMMARYPCFVVAPQCPGSRRWVEVSWSLDAHTMPEQPSEPLALTLQLLDELPKEFHIDPRRIYVTGLSMGGLGTWDILARRPKLFAAAMPVCGAADEHTAPLIKDIPIWTFHGDRDTTIKPSRSRNMVAALQAAGGHPRYSELLDVGHNAWTYAYNSTDIYDWLFAQQRPE